MRVGTALKGKVGGVVPMASTLLQSAMESLTPDLRSQAGSRLGESEDAVANALSQAAIPTVLAGLATRAQERGSADRLYALLDDGSFDPRAARSPAVLLGEGPASARVRELGGRLLALLFGGRLDRLTTALAEHAGVRPAAASSLLRVAAALALGLVHERVRRDGLDAAGLGRLLARERDELVAAVPPPLRDAVSPVAAPAADVAELRAGAPAWLWAALALLALALVWTIARGSRESPPSLAPRPDPELPDVAAHPVVTSFVKRRLPSGAELQVPSNGIEVRLVGLLEAGGDSEEWIEFDRLIFEPASPNLRPESQEQLRNVAAILLAYPDARVEIGGYTDNQGDPAANLRLSQERAANVKSSLVNLGVGGERIEAEGFGDQDPVATNDTASGRERNRRIALRVAPS